jgi:coproporphyrinogen III oxidase-like Fe-S oxidoreductase
VRDAGINVISNYIFGLEHDTHETMQQTLDLALELNTEMANMYPCQALPGSPLHTKARREGCKLPDSYAGYAFLSYESEPLATETLTSAEVLQFRDDAWQTYFTNPAYLRLVEDKFGAQQRANVEAMAQVKLRRRLLGHAPPERTPVALSSIS